MSEATQYDTQEVIQWYRNHETTEELGFNPDGMCLSIARRARNILPRFPSALSAAVNTPKKYRVHKIEDIRKGMVGFSDDPHDDNPFGHIYTFVGRTPHSDYSKLNSLLVRTNSVVSGRIVVVTADYFLDHWGDSFQFAATWLNGEPFYDLQKKPVPKKRKFKGLQASLASMQSGLKGINTSIRVHKNEPRLVHALERDRAIQMKAIADLRETIKQFELKKKGK